MYVYAIINTGKRSCDRSFTNESWWQKLAKFFLLEEISNYTAIYTYMYMCTCTYLALSRLQCHVRRVQQESCGIVIALKVERDTGLHHTDVADCHRLHVFGVASLLVALPGLAAVKWTKEVGILTEYKSLGDNLVLSKGPLATGKHNPTISKWTTKWLSSHTQT